MEVGAELVGMVNTNIKRIFKDIIEELTKDWPGGSYLMLRSKPVVPGDRPLISIGYKYNVWNVLFLIVTDNTGRTKAGIPYLYKYTDQFTNVTIFPVDRPLVMSNFFSGVNEVDSHKKSRHSDLELEKF